MIFSHLIDSVRRGSKVIGTVKWFSEEKGYGFITPANGGTDVFLHYSEIAMDLKTLKEGQTVSFTTTQSEKGPSAENVVLVE